MCFYECVSERVSVNVFPRMCFQFAFSIPSYRDKEKPRQAYTPCLKVWSEIPSYLSSNVKKQKKAHPIVPYSSIFIFFLSLVLNYSPKAAKPSKVVARYCQLQQQQEQRTVFKCTLPSSLDFLSSVRSGSNISS